MLAEHEAPCPYCGEVLSLLVDWSEAPAEYTEDCAVCCQPMIVRVDPGGDAWGPGPDGDAAGTGPSGSGVVQVRREDD